ncbi:hypothetical protein [Sorangium sp. So ce1097]|uniref:hypothetical protein n=1 Tax=Sorangium sp. So ce1097 TaxID=3133330 RepID=UPI003F60011D
MRLHLTSPVSAVSPHPPGARRRPRHRPLLSAAVAGSLVATAAAPAGAEETITVRLLPQKELEPGKLEVLPDRVIPASKEFAVVVPARTEHEKGTLDVWPKVDKDCGTVPAKDPRRAQHHTLAMRITGEDAERAFQAIVPPLQVGATFCFHVQRTIKPSAANEEKIIRFAVGAVAQYINVSRPVTVDGIQKSFREGIIDGMIQVYPWAAVSNVHDAAERALKDLIASEKVGPYLAAEDLVAASDPDNQRSERERRRDEAKEALRLAIEKSAQVASRALHIEEASTLSLRPDAGKTPEAGNYVALDAGVVLAAPMRGDGPSFWLVPYFGVNFYAVPVDRTIPVNDLVGSPLWQRLSLTLGVSLTEPSLPGRATRGILFDRYPMAALGYRMTHFVRVTAGAAFYEITDSNPASSEYHFAVAPFAGASLDIDVVHMITEAFAKL